MAGRRAAGRSRGIDKVPASCRRDSGSAAYEFAGSGDRRYLVRRAAWPRAGPFVRAAPQLAVGLCHFVGFDLRRRHAGIRHRRSDDHRVQHMARMAPALCRRRQRQNAHSGGVGTDHAGAVTIVRDPRLHFADDAGKRDRSARKRLREGSAPQRPGPAPRDPLSCSARGTGTYALRDSAFHRMDGGRPRHRREPVRLPRDRAIAGVRDS